MQASGWTAKCHPASAAVAGVNIWLHGCMSAADNVLLAPEEDQREPKAVSIFKVLFKPRGLYRFVKNLIKRSFWKLEFLNITMTGDLYIKNNVCQRVAVTLCALNHPINPPRWIFGLSGNELKWCKHLDL